MARKFKRDRYVSASELAQAAHCPLFYYKNINREPLTEQELRRIRRGNFMHDQMARFAHTDKDISNVIPPSKTKGRFLLRVLSFLRRLFFGAD